MPLPPPPTIAALPAGDEYIINALGYSGTYDRMLALVLNERARELAGEYLGQLGYHELRVGYIIALVHIDSDGVNINYLAQKTGMSKQAMSQLVLDNLDAHFAGRPLLTPV